MTATVNGAAWVAGGHGTTLTAGYYQGTRPLLAVGGLEVGQYYVRAITLYICGVTAPGSYTLASINTGSYATWEDSEGILGDPGYTVSSSATDTTHQGTVIVTRFDPGTRTAEGTFSFDTFTQASQGAVHVTGGHFSVRYTARVDLPPQC